MRSKIIEVCQPTPVNWGKFMIAEFDENETSYISVITKSPLLPAIGYWGEENKWLWLLDLQTGEGALFPVSSKGNAKYQLDKHKIWVCLLYEPLLEWLYQNYKGDIDEIPSYIEIDAPAGLYGYRRSGTGNVD